MGSKRNAELIKAARLLNDNCGNCNICLFFLDDFCVFMGDTPEDWKIYKLEESNGK